MPLTVSNVVSRLVGRLRGKLAATGLSVVPDDTNPDLVDGVLKGCVWVGVVPASPVTVVDADLAKLTVPQALKLLDAATLESLYLCLGACNFIDEVVGDNEQDLSQLEASIQKMIAMLEDRLRKPYGPTMPIIAVGKTGQADSPMPNDPFNIWPSISNRCDWPYTSFP